MEGVILQRHLLIPLSLIARFTIDLTEEKTLCTELVARPRFNNASLNLPTSNDVYSDKSLLPNSSITFCVFLLATWWNSFGLVLPLRFG